RELNEELGVHAKIGKEILRKRHQYEQMREPVQLIFFEAHVEASEIENRIFEKIEWVEPEKLAKMDFLEADRELIEKLATGEIRV
ncbi:MAG: hypothetical protein WBD21_02305, partial [Candidatus Acidiferrales bacterium]